jgi:hypothetical protein
MLPFGVTIPATVPQGSEIPEGLMNNPVLQGINASKNNIWTIKLDTYRKETVTDNL